MTLVRTRIAPSPTGYPHIGTVYQALFDYSFAKKYDGQFLVRIEDTDRTRFVADAEEKIFAALDWFGLSENESPRKGGKYSPYRQSERIEIYQKHAKQLVEKSNAYYCFCSKERLEEMRQRQTSEKKPMMYDKHCRNLPPAEVEMLLNKQMSWVVRLKIPENQTLTVRDEIRGDIVFDTNLIEDTVILKSDGFATYHLAAMVDDHLMEVTHILRGEEWISSLPKHVLIFDYFGWVKPLFFHTPVLRNPDKSKLSKRHSHTSVSWYQAEGYLPEAILNFLALMGWSHPEGKEIFSLNEFISLVELKDLKAVGPIFDLTKLTWMNQQYIQNLSNDALIAKLKAFYTNLKEVDDHLLIQLVPLLKERMQTLKDFTVLTGHFFEEPEIVLGNDQEKKVAQQLLDLLIRVTDWQKDSIFIEFKKVMTTEKIRMPLLYKLFTGAERGLPLPESLAILGKERTLARLKRILS